MTQHQPKTNWLREILAEAQTPPLKVAPVSAEQRRMDYEASKLNPAYIEQQKYAGGDCLFNDPRPIGF